MATDYVLIAQFQNYDEPDRLELVIKASKEVCEATKDAQIVLNNEYNKLMRVAQGHNHGIKMPQYYNAEFSIF